jgi:hypothetical protein
MPAARALVPEIPSTPYTKPTLANTHNGKTYRPTDPDLRIEFSSSITPGAHDGEGGGEETFSSRLVAVRVSCCALNVPDIVLMMD